MILKYVYRDPSDPESTETIASRSVGDGVMVPDTGDRLKLEGAFYYVYDRCHFPADGEVHTLLVNLTIEGLESVRTHDPFADAAAVTTLNDE